MKLLNLIIGSLFLSSGLFFVIIYLNLFVIGYTFFDFVYFIIRKGIIIFFILGVFILIKGRRRI